MSTIDRKQASCLMQDLHELIRTQTHPATINLLPGGDPKPVAHATMLLGKWCDDFVISGKDADSLVFSRGRIWEIKEAVNIVLEHFRIELGDFDVKDSIYEGNLVKEGRGDKNVYTGDVVTLNQSVGLTLRNMELAWSMDEMVGLRGSRGCLIQSCDIAEPLNYSYQLNKAGNNIGKVASHAMGILQSYIDKGNSGITGGGAIQPNRFDRCFFAHCFWRLPQASNQGNYHFTGDPALDENMNRRVNNLIWTNNLIYNYGRPMHHNSVQEGSIKLDMIGNLYVVGPEKVAHNYWYNHWQHLQHLLNAGRVYAKNNWVMDANNEIHTLEDWTTSGDIHIDWSNNRTSPNFDVSGRPLLNTPKEVEKYVLKYSGCYLHKGEHRQRLREEYKNRTGKIINSQDEVLS